MALPNKLDSARLTEASLGTDIPGALSALEQAIADILGITIDSNVTANLGLTNAGILTTALIEQKAAAPVGFRFKDSTGGAEFRVVNDGTYVSIDNNTGTEATPIWTNLWKMAIATGVATFSDFPVTPSSAPDADYEVSNKKYVDDQIGGIPSLAAASQTEQEAGTEAGKYVAPATQKYHPSAAKAWVLFDGTTASPTPIVGYNVTSITKNGTGDYTINFTTAFSGANYAFSGICRGTSGHMNVPMIHGTVDPTASSCRIVVNDYQGNVANTISVSMVFFGDQ